MPSTAQPAAETAEKKSHGLGSYVLWAFVAVMLRKSLKLQTSSFRETPSSKPPKQVGCDE
jgi:hypothetical protein